MKVLNLRRRRAESPVEDIISALHTEVEKNGHSAGIDMLRRRLFLKFKIIAKRLTIKMVQFSYCFCSEMSNLREFNSKQVRTFLTHLIFF
jgi:hypothetical protein